MLIILSVCFVMMASAHVHWVSVGHNVMNVRMAGITSPVVAVSLATVSSWEANQMFVINLLVFVIALMEPLVICVMLALLELS